MLAVTASDLVNTTVKNPGIVIGLSLDFTSLLLVAVVTMLLSALRHQKIHQLIEKVQSVQKFVDPQKRRIRMKRSLLALWILGIGLAILTEAMFEKTPIVQNLLRFYIQLIKLYIAVRNLEVVGQIIEAAKVLNSKMAAVSEGDGGVVTVKEREKREWHKIKCIRTLGGVHWMICESIQDVSEVYGIQLLLEVLCLFVLITTTSYSAYSTYQNGKFPEAYYCTTCKLCWTILEVVELIVLIVPCATATEEANKTQTIVCQLLNKKLTSGVRKALSTLALHLPHHNTRFSAYGMFYLDLSVISTVTGAVATYLIMIIQFQDAKVIKKAIDNV
ncbi:gustatory receptor 68a-like [Nilaparvata lugens]|uniref:gustatory receptor 68a-like n=1 Tax=Nilaparvata lugens TaxID=108931 RepID=UPI00193CEA12|nr:gustatory receptor 68a-like [Nilaparvata lugens]